MAAIEGFPLAHQREGQNDDLREPMPYGSHWVVIVSSQFLAELFLGGGMYNKVVTREVCFDPRTQSFFYALAAINTIVQGLLLVKAVGERVKVSRPDQYPELEHQEITKSLKCCLNISIVSSIAFLALTALTVGVGAEVCS